MFGRLLDLLFPPKCAFCRTVTDGARVCAACMDSLPRTAGADRDAGGDFLDGCVTPLRYAGTVRDSIHRFKFGGLSCYAPAYAALLAPAVRERLQDRIDVIAWVPVSRRRRRERGYDQAQLLAQELAKQLDLPYERLLLRTRNTAANSSLQGAEKRRANVAGAFQAIPERAAGRRILLADDVYTTGATMSECARMLLMAGAESVHGAAVARAGEKPEAGG